MHLPIVALAAKKVYGEDLLGDYAETVRGYGKMVNQRPAVKRTNDDLKAFVARQQQAG